MTETTERTFQLDGRGVLDLPIMGEEQFAESFEAAFEQARSDENDKIEAMRAEGGYSGPVWSECARVIVYDVTGDEVPDDLDDCPSVTFAYLGGNEWQEVARDGDAA